jgi:ribonuclease P protein component
VVPKRHAKRAVTRTLIKRQIRRAIVDEPGLAGGLWVVRLRSPFDRATYDSAASEALRRAAAAELTAVLSHAARRAAA